jgi:rfaE bifunctional protein kinase chain/domain
MKELQLKDLQPETIEALEQIKTRTKDKNRVVFVSGFFNVLHPGHLRLLRFAKECGDFLVVGVLGDTLTDRHILSEDLRKESVVATSWVDFAFIQKDSSEKLIQALKPAVVVKGNEFAGQANPEQEILESYGGELLFNSGEFGFSSLDLLRNEFRRLSLSGLIKPKDFLERHGSSTRDLCKVLERMKSVQVLLIGDTIIDEYISCDPVGMSQEDPTIVVTPLFSESFLGGAGIVAAHTASLGGSVDFFTITGKDADSRFVKEQLEKFGVNAFVSEDRSRITTRKQRFRAAGKTLLRVNHQRQHEITPELQKKILKNIINRLDQKNLVIFSDFNYGCLPQPLVDGVIKACRERGIKMAADSQSSSQVGNVSRFHDMDLLSPTEREARLVNHDFRSGLVQMTRNLQLKSNTKNIFLTMGREGMLVHASASGGDKEWDNDQLPAMNKAPVDVAGAGDSLLVASSLALAANASIWEAAYLGSLAAACQISRLGNIPLKTEELLKELVE